MKRVNKVKNRKLVKSAGLFGKEEKYDFLYNACVGNNGWISINTYISGYQAATLVMLESALESISTRKNVPDNAEMWNIDTAIYPILFSARHYVELYLKQKIYAINYFKLKEKIEEKLIRTHDIKRLWDIFIDIFDKTYDFRIKEFIDFISPYIEDFSEIDPTGEVFRYPYNNDYTKKHLEERTVIGLANFYEKFKDLTEKMTAFTYYMDFLIDEYKTGTYTKKLNREDIEKIAKELPVFNEWNSESFKLVKESIKDKFNIGSKELSNVIDIIKNHIEFKRYIYPDIYELEVDKIKLINFLNGKYSSGDIKDFDKKEIASLRTLVELGTSIIDGRYYSEDYSRLYEHFLENIINEEYYKISDYEYSLVNKHRILKGLDKIGYSSIYKQ